MSRVPKHVAAEVLERSAGYCEACGGLLIPGHPREHGIFHHRLPRSAGGRDETVNLLNVHDACHNVAPGSIHQNSDRSYRLGHLLRRGEDPAQIAPQVVRELRQLRA